MTILRSLGSRRQRRLASGLAAGGGFVGAALVGTGRASIGAIVAGSLLLAAYALPHLTDGSGWDERDRTVRERAAKRAVDAVAALAFAALIVGGVLAEVGRVQVTTEALVALGTVFAIWGLTGVFETYGYYKRT